MNGIPGSQGTGGNNSMSQTSTTSDQISMVGTVIKELTIHWETPKAATLGVFTIRSTFGAYDPRLQPIITQVDPTTYHCVLQVYQGGQGSKVVKALKLVGGEITNEVRVPQPKKRPNTGNKGYADTFDEQYDAADFLAAVEVTLSHPEIFKDGVVQYHGHRIPMNSMRYQNFLHHGCKCVKCGIEGTFFLKQRTHVSDPDYHMNLYALGSGGEKILMTRDHVVPKAKGGPNTLENLQTMCGPCNWKKGDKLQ